MTGDKPSQEYEPQKIENLKQAIEYWYDDGLQIQRKKEDEYVITLGGQGIDKHIQCLCEVRKWMKGWDIMTAFVSDGHVEITLMKR